MLQSTNTHKKMRMTNLIIFKSIENITFIHDMNWGNDMAKIIIEDHNYANVISKSIKIEAYF